MNSVTIPSYKFKTKIPLKKWSEMQTEIVKHRRKILNREHVKIYITTFRLVGTQRLAYGCHIESDNVMAKYSSVATDIYWDSSEAWHHAYLIAHKHFKYTAPELHPYDFPKDSQRVFCPECNGSVFAAVLDDDGNVPADSKAEFLKAVGDGFSTDRVSSQFIRSVWHKWGCSCGGSADTPSNQMSLL